ncbi:hypothetical protein CASFOL_024196 [Castilleja foliolosa]|uniref:Uncharacterized protein n=1 Tax=Castilleja foliolosa TaxID=1961234 RepID=A0ABD3CNP8_9LAMI
MDYLSDLVKGSDQPKPKTDQPSNPDNKGYDLSGTAKVVAGSTADILGAASDYGKLDETKGVGKYVDQAETYLRNYNTSDSPAAPASGEHKPVVEEKIAPPAAVAETTEGEKPAAGGGGAVDYVKNFLNKPSGEEESTKKPEGGFGDDLKKMAGGFMK